MTRAAALAVAANAPSARNAFAMSPVAMLARIATPSERPISWPVVFRPDSIPVSSAPAPGTFCR
jgi:hypothetical protein